MRLAHEGTYELEERLSEIRAKLARFSFDGVSLSAEEVRGLVEEIDTCRCESIAMRCELSRSRWNGRGRADPLADIVVEESSRDGSNLMLFPVIGRPIPGDAVQRLPMEDAGRDHGRGDGWDGGGDAA